MANSESIKYRIEGLDCPDCALSLERAVVALPEIDAAQVLYATGQLTVTSRAVANTLPAITRIAEGMGYRVGHPGALAGSGPRGWRDVLRLHRRRLATAGGVLFLLLALLSGSLGVPLIVTQLLYAASIGISGFFVARAGWLALTEAHHLDMNALMVIAAVGAMFVGEHAEGAVTLILFSVGELLESYAADKARGAVHALMELAPAEALRRDRDGEKRVPVAELEIGDEILVRPGERLPMDARVLEGTSWVDQAPITGESTSVEKTLDDEVFAGTINGNGALRLQVTRLAQDNAIARILRLVEEAQGRRAPAQRFVDRFARIYTPAVLVVAVGVAALPPLLGMGPLTEWVYRALVLLVISCPCALVISTPVTIVSAMARAARSGVLIKGGRYLEELASVRAIAFDKTGTLTKGEPRIVAGACDLHPEGRECQACRDLLAKAAAVESRSEHALGQALVQHAQQLGVADRYAQGEQVTAVAGRGIRGLVEGHQIAVGNHDFCHPEGNPEEELCREVLDVERRGYTVLVVKDDCCDARCYFAVGDSIRDDAKEVIADLARSGIEKTIMLTGDNGHIARTIADEVGIEEVRAGLLPEDKVAVVQQLIERYGRVAMIGDGVNDAPALATASLGIVMGAIGSDAALEAADVALMSDNLSRLPYAIRLGRSAMRTVRANIIFALMIKLVFLVLAATGVATLWMAVVADTGASLAVSLNGLRLLGYKERAAKQSRVPGQ